MTDVNSLRESRRQETKDIYSGVIPKRVPIHLSPAFEACASYAIAQGVVKDKNLRNIYWEPDLWYDIFDRMNNDFYSDIPVGVGAIRLPILYQILDAKAINMSKTGVMQHPEVYSLEVEEYDEFIKDPFLFMSETMMPRIYPALDTTPGRRAMKLAQAVKANYDHMAKIGQIMGKIAEKYGFPPAAMGRSTAPFDFLADFLRSFTGISKDVRRCPEKVLAACDALIPLMLREGLGTNPAALPPHYRISIPLHMGSFLNDKQFEKFWWPSFKVLMDKLVEYGHGVDLFVEDDWMRYMDHMKTFEGVVKMQFEYGDPKLVKEKLAGTKHVITGFYPISMLQYGTKQQVIDKAKEQIDILAPGGGYIFGFDKGLFSLEEPIASNLRALVEFVREYAVY
jgi:hypothetical protein